MAFLILRIIDLSIYLFYEIIYGYTFIYVLHLYICMYIKKLQNRSAGTYGWRETSYVGTYIIK